jgi:NhaA family Na+:H+ antiporter
MTMAKPSSSRRSPPRPLQRFIEAESAGGIVLIAAAAVALAWANSPWGGSYDDLWGAYLEFDLNFTVVREDLGHFVNDAVMAVFFFVVGLEIKRELLHGELASMRRAMLPVAAALGGMAVPALIYAALNAGGDGAGGWGIPMATDIAFALGVLALAGPGVPISLKVFLLALAIVDDLGAILVIAIFYTSDLDLASLGWAVLVVVAVLAAQRAGIRVLAVYVALGGLLWLAVYASGVHATLAGVVLALLTPAGRPRSLPEYHGELRSLMAQLASAEANADEDAQRAITEELDRLTDEREPPLQRLERILHPWSSFLIVPVFALANAGLDLSSDVASNLVTSPVSLGVVLGLVAGKPVGILLACWLAIRFGGAGMPAGAKWRHLAGVGVVAGIGFTVSIFISSLAFDEQGLEAEAKAGIFAASVLAAVAGLALLRAGDRPGQHESREAAAS